MHLNLSDGIFLGNFKTDKNGTKENPITLNGSRSAILTNPANDAFYLTGSYWILKGSLFIVQNLFVEY